MRYSLRGLLLVLLALGSGACDRGAESDQRRRDGASGKGADQASRPEARPADEPPLLLEDAPPAEPSTSSPEGPVADNTRCHVCHTNYEDEKLAVTHAGHGIGCQKCHGPSDAHCGDEDNITPPDVMFARERLNPACQQCHPQLSEVHKPVLAGTSDKKYCTDCHEFASHRLAHRTRRWDKTTRQLLSSDGVRMKKDN